MKTIYLKSINNKAKKWSAVLLASMIALSFGCTKNFEEYNTNPNSLSPEQTESLLQSAIGPIQQEIFHNYQIAQNLSADAFSGYMMAPNPFGGINNMNYSLNDGWNSAGFNDQYNYVMAPISKIALTTKLKVQSPESWGIALIVQVMSMSRVTDKFGPIPYTTAGSSLVSTPYEDQKTVYNAFFKQIDTAANNLQAFITANPGKKAFYDVGDLIYAGDPVQWLKLTNSLRLRLAMRIVKADGATAKLQAEKALSATGGLLATPSDNAAVAQSGTRDNDLWVVTVGYDGDNALGAALQSYLVGYNDPRLPIYATPAKDPLFAGQYIGIRSGANTTFNGLGKDGYKTYSSLNSTGIKSPSGQKAPQILMTAAEVWFLKAEAALRGWAGAGDAQANYEKGISTSMQQWDVSIGTYLSNTTAVQAAYTDPKNPANNSSAVSTITIKWDAGATNEQKLERIITQKWLAIFPDGQEAWSEYRRTGYPKLFTAANNFSGGTINTQTQIRRLPYPATEYGNGNADEVSKAVTLLGGPDNGGTRLWWDVDKANF